MIAGQVNGDLEAVIEIHVQDYQDNIHTFQCVLDTGFDGFLSLPADVIQRLGLAGRGHRETTLSDDTVIFLPVYLGIVVWQGEMLEIYVLEGGQEFLVGTALLENSTLTVQVWDGGDVLIEPR